MCLKYFKFFSYIIVSCIEAQRLNPKFLSLSDKNWSSSHAPELKSKFSIKKFDFKHCFLIIKIQKNKIFNI